jgi:hypothetical protein
LLRGLISFVFEIAESPDGRTGGKHQQTDDRTEKHQNFGEGQNCVNERVDERHAGIAGGRALTPADAETAAAESLPNMSVCPGSKSQPRREEYRRSGSVADQIALFFVLGPVDFAAGEALIKDIERSATTSGISRPPHNPNDDGDDADQSKQQYEWAANHRNRARSIVR